MSATVAYGVKLLAKHGDVRRNGRAYEVTIGENIVHFFPNGEDRSDNTITNEAVRRIGHEDDMASDYCAWTFFPSLKAAIECALREKARAHPCNDCGGIDLPIVNEAGYCSACAGE